MTKYRPLLFLCGLVVYTHTHTLCVTIKLDVFVKCNLTPSFFYRFKFRLVKATKQNKWNIFYYKLIKTMPACMDKNPSKLAYSSAILCSRKKIIYWECSSFFDRTLHWVFNLCKRLTKHFIECRMNFLSMWQQQLTYLIKNQIFHFFLMSFFVAGSSFVNHFLWLDGVKS